MRVYRSNRTEALLAALADVIAEPLADPFASECIVVQGRGMERWLAQALAARHGVFANARFPFPKALLESVLASVLGKVERPGIDYEPEAMMWSIADLLPALLEDPRFEPIAGYLADDPGGARRVQLAERIADVFDHYVTYRPEMILAWDAGDETAARHAGGGDDGWQSVLWRALVARHGASHLAARTKTFLDGLATGAPDLGSIPRRICFFGFSTLPPLYVSAFAAIADHVALHLFVPSPSSGYWADIRSEREVFRRLRAEGRRGAGADAEPDADSYADADPDSSKEEMEALHLEAGNPLLASMGRVGRDFQEILESRVDYTEPEGDLYLDPLDADAGPGAPTMLHVVQSDILALRHRGRVGDADPACAPLPRPADDTSIRVHACHSPMREAEVLRDQLLDLFARDPSLEPRDVVVMCPDVDAYAPFVEAVFAGERGGSRIPCRFADRSARSSFEIVEAFFGLLDVLAGRFDAGAVLDLLGIDAVCARFGIERADEPQLRAWLMESGIRWGVDADHRSAEGQPDTSQNTWRFGLERLLLGYAMPEGYTGSVAGRRPVGEVEGSDAALLGKLAEFCETLFGFRARLVEPRGLESWRRLLGELLDRMLASDAENGHQHQSLRAALAELAEAGERAGYAGEVDLETLRDQLGRGLDRNVPGGAFLSGGVTFCELVPMRTIPFRVVCLLGMSDDAFPRIRQPTSFDLMARRRMPGDRTSRDDDRYLFLEALLAARDHLIITYVGQDARDNAPRPPSVLVGELLDYLAGAFVPAETAPETLNAADAVREAIVTEHPLQPFSPSYFAADADARLFSYSSADREAAAVLASPRLAPGVFVVEPLADAADGGLAGETARTIDLDLLQRFFQRPVETFMRERLGLFLGEDAEPLEGREPMTLAGLDLWRVGDLLLDRRLRGEDPADELAVLRAEGRLPLGAVGASAYAEVAEEVARIEARVRALTADARPMRVGVDLPVAGARLVGRLDGVFEAGQVCHGFSKLGQRSELGCWVRHLALCCLAPEGVELVSYMIGRPETRGGARRQVVFRRPDDPEAGLASLVETFELGMRSPLPLFPRASRKYAATLLRARGDDPEEQASKSAYDTYKDRQSDFLEADDAYNALAFGELDPLGVGFAAAGSDAEHAGFRALAARVFDPLLAVREERE